jgi:2'-5' RNA ligase
LLPSKITGKIWSSSFRLSCAGVKTDQLHITLKFVGELQENHLQPILDEMGRTFSKVNQFPLQLRGTGVFPNLKGPRILWLGINPSNELLELVKMNESIFHAFGYIPEKRPFQAHITVGRFKDLHTRQDLEKFQLLFDVQKQNFQAQQVIDHLTFYQSILTRQGPIYKILSKVIFH